MSKSELPLPPREVSLVTLGLDVPRGDPGPATHPWHEVIYLLQGRYRAWVGGEGLGLEPGTFLHLPAGTPHRSDNPRDRSLQFLVLALDEPVLGEAVFTTRDAGGRVLTVLQWLRDTFPRSGEEDDLLHRCLVAAFAREVRDLRADPASTADPVRRAREFFRHNLDRPSLSLAEVAEVVGLSPATLERRFRAAEDLPPMAWLQRLRARRGLELLRGTALPVSEVARAVGFLSPSHFSRLLRREFGRPPRELRRGGDQPETAPDEDG
jgi:AraC-like DNA-binding protein/mannose-6-phosphate isomerase-like protein (cupin superfamily)